MKTLFESRYTHFIICSDIKPVMQTVDGKNCPVYVDKEAGIAEHIELVNQVQFYVHKKDYNGYNTEKATCVYLNSEDILLLADKIREMHNREIQTQYVESDDLPF